MGHRCFSGQRTLQRRFHRRIIFGVFKYFGQRVQTLHVSGGIENLGGEFQSIANRLLGFFEFALLALRFESCRRDWILRTECCRTSVFRPIAFSRCFSASAKLRDCR